MTESVVTPAPSLTYRGYTVALIEGYFQIDGP